VAASVKLCCPWRIWAGYKYEYYYYYLPETRWILNSMEILLKSPVLMRICKAPPIYGAVVEHSTGTFLIFYISYLETNEMKAPH